MKGMEFCINFCYLYTIFKVKMYKICYNIRVIWRVGRAVYGAGFENLWAQVLRGSNPLPSALFTLCNSRLPFGLKNRVWRRRKWTFNLVIYYEYGNKENFSE